MTISPNRCAQASIVGTARFANDRLISLSDDASALLKEIDTRGARLVLITPHGDNTLEFTAERNGERVPYDDSMRDWVAHMMPEVLSNSSIDAPQRVARELARGGVSSVLALIDRLHSTSAMTAHYEALLDGRPLTEAEYQAVSRHATKHLANSPRDLGEILTRVAASPAGGTKGLKPALIKLFAAQQALSEALDDALDQKKSSGDSASTLTQYAMTDDADMILLALEGAKSISSDGDKRAFLETVAPGALRRRKESLRSAYFGVVSTIKSSGDLRLAVIAALPFGHADPEITTKALDIVRRDITSDGDKRVVLVAVANQRLLNSPSMREQFMSAARSITSPQDMRVVMQAVVNP
jgi:hypothetical protein